MANTDGLQFQDLESKLKEIETTNAAREEIFSILDGAREALAAERQRFGYDENQHRNHTERLFVENALSYRPLSLTRNVTVPGYERLKGDDLQYLASILLDDQKWANDSLLQTSFISKLAAEVEQVDSDPFQVLLQLAIRQRAVLRNEQRSRMAIGTNGRYIIDRDALDLLPHDSILRKFFKFCQRPNGAEIELLSRVTRNTEAQIRQWFEKQRENTDWFDLLKVYAKEFASDPGAVEKLSDRLRVVLRTKGKHSE